MITKDTLYCGVVPFLYMGSDCCDTKKYSMFLCHAAVMALRRKRITPAQFEWLRITITEALGGEPDRRVHDFLLENGYIKQHDNPQDTARQQVQIQMYRSRWLRHLSEQYFKEIGNA